MSRLHHSSSHRRQAAPVAKGLVLGFTEARLVAHGQRGVHIASVKPDHHRKRYLAGQRLHVKAFVGGPIEARIIVTSAERIQLLDVDFPLARALGHVRLDDFRSAWVAEHEPAFDGDPLERFERRHAHRDIWAIRFALDRAAPPRLLAARSDELYVESPAQAMADEPEALSAAEWKLHVDGNRDLSHEQWLALGRLSSTAAKAQARIERGRNMRKKAA
jgi:hypothetical protein